MSVRAGIKLPEAVRASDGSKYFLPSTEPAWFFRGCAEWRSTMPHGHADGRGPAQAHPPLDARPGQPVQDIKPDRQERGDDMRPIGDGAQARVFQAQVLELENINARQQQRP